MGLFYVCFKLSELGWNVMPTSRNARGIDIVCFSMDGSRMLTVQVKSLSKRDDVWLPSSLDKITGDFWIIVNSLAMDAPRSYILLPHEVKALADRQEKEGRVMCWLTRRAYAVEAFEEKWERVGPAA